MTCSRKCMSELSHCANLNFWLAWARWLMVEIFSKKKWQISVDSNAINHKYKESLRPRCKPIDNVFFVFSLYFECTRSLSWTIVLSQFTAVFNSSLVSTHSFSFNRACIEICYWGKLYPDICVISNTATNQLKTKAESEKKESYKFPRLLGSRFHSACYCIAVNPGLATPRLPEKSDFVRSQTFAHRRAFRFPSVPKFCIQLLGSTSQSQRKSSCNHGSEPTCRRKYKQFHRYFELPIILLQCGWCG